MSGLEIASAITAGPGLLLACIECFDLIRLGRNFGTDYQQYLLELQVSKLRLRRTGKSLGIPLNDPDAVLPESLSDDQDADRLAKELLGRMINQFKDLTTISDRYEVDGDADIDAMEEHEIEDSSTRTLCVKIRKASTIRSNKTTLVNKVIWVCGRKKELQCTLAQVNTNINSLSDVLNTRQEETRHAKDDLQAIKKGVKDIDEMMSILTSIASGMDEALSNAAAETLTRPGHTYKSTWVNDCRSVHFGDAIRNGAVGGQGGVSHLFIETMTTNCDGVHFGNRPEA
ncbi:hypothetical protein SLS57_011326 [Botryosphaeria dothidea]